VTDLRSLQHAFAAYVLTDEAAVSANIVDTPAYPAAERLRVYSEGYRLRLLEALTTDYPALRYNLGAERFEQLARGYIEAVRSRHFSLRYFGQELSQHLKSNGKAQAQPWLADLAAFEWALGEVFDAADAPPVDVTAVTGIAPEQWVNITLSPIPAIRRLDLTWNVQSFWQACEDECAVPEPASAAQPVAWLIWRRELRVYFRSLSAHEAWAIDAAGGGMRFGDLCIGLCDWLAEDEVAACAAGWLRTWLEAGLIAALSVPD
jgi:hypothetical protein